MKKSSLRIALVLLAVLFLALFVSCGTKTTDAPAENSPSASQPADENSSIEQPSPPRLEVGTDGSVPEIDWND
ncbi:MAG: hypothetical protein IJZ37_01150 [Clostridia bacterium]|nr:hypothetical protein [Clostridia bacterium]MBQ8235274.1 hypothetical protein [Clostridia bacterium]MBQ8399872.1 hypothetical protein [Clostridia bacterium]